MNAEILKKYINKSINLQNIKNSKELEKFNIWCEYLPDPPEDFDEIEFRTNFKDKTISIDIVIQSGKIQRIMFASVDPKDPTLVKSLTQSELQEFLKERESDLINFFNYITQ
ncbi:MAG: hypothetical protein DRP29_03975 [Thermodesulfobacteriota bacterium]|nr:MAG: hypothetical protein DRP29_03975 [Thermodesulfobacteriota bacterium]RLG10301.1 MAG: hypothetical protein DRN73_08115 [Candidatus Pacearchaeota archaeon]